MADCIIPKTIAPAHFVELTDAQGRLVLLPQAMVHMLVASGQTSLVLRVNLTGKPSRPWITVSEAARLFMTDVDGMTLKNARSRISHACSKGEIVSEGIGPQRRIDPTSLDAWRLAQREKNLAKYDDA